MPNYQALSKIYDLLDVLYFKDKERSPRTAMLSAIPDTPISVLDVCAGTCSNSILIANNRPQAKITALDLSAEMLKIAERKFRQQNISNIKTVVADACNTGFPDKTFDVILLSLILHEVSDGIRFAILREAKRLLTDDGRIIVIEWEQPKKLTQRFKFRLIKMIEPRGFRSFLREDLTKYFSGRGLNIIDKKSCDYTQVLTLSKAI